MLRAALIALVAVAEEGCNRVAERTAKVDVTIGTVSVRVHVDPAPGARSSSRTVMFARGDFGAANKYGSVDGIPCDGGGVGQCTDWHECEEALTRPFNETDFFINVSGSLDFDYCGGGVVAEFRALTDFFIPEDCPPSTARPPSNTTNKNKKRASTAFERAVAYGSFAALLAMALAVLLAFLLVRRPPPPTRQNVVKPENSAL